MLVAVGTALQQRRRAQLVRACWIAGAALLMLAVTVQPFRDTDVWWHLAMGQFITLHGIPHQEPFSFLSAANPWVGQQWLYEVLLAGLVGAGGFGLASVVMGVLGACALAVAAGAVPRSERVPGTALAPAMVLSGLVMAQLVGVRGQVITLFCFAVVLFVLARWREGRTFAVWFLPPLFLLWANLHAGFVAGFAVLVLALLLVRPHAEAQGARRQLGLALVVSAAATLLNPAGPGLYGYVAETFGNPTLTQVVTEWTSPDFHNLWLRLFEIEVVLLVIAWIASGGPDRFHLVLATGLLIASLQAQRNVSLFAIAAVPQLALYGTRAFEQQIAPRLRRLHAPRFSPGLSLAGVVIIAAAVGATVATQLTPASISSFVATRYPEAAATWYSAHLSGQRIYSPDTWGGYLAYRFPQGRVVFLYDETAVFGSAALQRYLDIHGLRQDWTEVLTEERIDNAIVPLQSDEASALHELGWVIDCSDAASGALVMSAPPSQGVRTETASQPLQLPLSGVPSC
mgnify:CR=1 FL=1